MSIARANEAKRIYGKDIADMTFDELKKFRAWLAREPKEELVPQPMFYLHGIPYLPSYNDKHKWVGPGTPDTRLEYTTTELLEPGSVARLSVKMLWRRSWTEEINGWKML